MASLKIIRTETHGLPTTPSFVEDVECTVDAYQRIVRMVILVSLWNWNQAFDGMGKKDRLTFIEGLIHPTADRPVVKYPMVSRAMGNMPSYLRRAAIHAGIGAASSFRSNYENWLRQPVFDRQHMKDVKLSLWKTEQAAAVNEALAHAKTAGHEAPSDEPRPRGSKPPRLGVTGLFPSLYGGNMILEGGAVSPRKPVKVPTPDAKPKSEKQLRAIEQKAAALYTPPGHVRIKLLGADGQWRFSGPLKVRGRMKRLAGKLDLAPTLVLKGKKVALSCPVEFNRPWYMTDKTFRDSVLGQMKEKVCAGDAGINTAITAAVVDASGTVINRRFIRCDRHDGQRDALMDQIDRKRSQSGSSMRGQPFCHELYERISGIGLDAARYLAREFVAFARANGARILVIENLKGFRPKGRGPRQKRRFHRFEHRRWVECVKLLAEEFGLRVLEVWPRGTSRWAFDGSGEVTRDKSNAANATFSNGKRYNADLNGACNIAARGLAMLLGIRAPAKHTTKVPVGSAPCSEMGTGGGKSSPPKERMPLALFHVWDWYAARHAGASSPGPLVTDDAALMAA